MTALDLEAGGIIWALKRLRGYLWSTHFGIYRDHQALISIVKMGEHARVQRWLDTKSSLPEGRRRTGTPISCLVCRSVPRPPTLVVQTALVTWTFRVRVGFGPPVAPTAPPLRRTSAWVGEPSHYPPELSRSLRLLPPILVIFVGTDRTCWTPLVWTTTARLVSLS